MKNFTKRQWLIIGEVILAVVIIVLWSIELMSPAPKSLSTLATATSTSISTLATSTIATSTKIYTNKNISKTKRNLSVVKIKLFPINKLDKITSWSFKGAYSGSTALRSKMNTDIKYLTSLFGKGKYDDYDLYNGIANDYMLLGNGKTAYQYYNRSIQIHPKKGLAYTNLAHLMVQLRAYYTASDAYAKAVTVEPGMLEYHLARLNFLTQQFPKNNLLVSSAFVDASKQFGDNASILAIEAQWLTSLGKYSDAIKAWQTAKKLSPGKDTTAIDAEIARLKAKK